jgi:hypothetical protein
LVALLRNQFQPADYNDRLFEEIRRRTQGPDESIAMFAAVMDNMFDRVTVRVPEATRLKIILKNLAPYYQNQLGLSPITSRDQLLEASRLLEARKASVECYVQPTRRRGQICLEPDLAYVQVDGLFGEELHPQFSRRPAREGHIGKVLELRQAQPFFPFVR